jgi:hypothetical protein
MRGKRPNNRALKELKESDKITLWIVSAIAIVCLVLVIIWRFL